MPDPTWKVAPHGPINQLTESIWTVTGEIPGLEMPLLRVLTIVRLADGRLVLHNGMALDEDEMKRIEAWGRPAFLLVPNGWHRIDAPKLAHRYPDLTVLCPEGARKKVEEVVTVSGTYDDFPADDRVKLRHLEGVGRGEGYLEVRDGSEVTLIFNDVVFNQKHLPGFFGMIYRLIGSTGGPRVTWMLKMTLVKDRRALREDLERLADTPGLARVVVMHGDLVTDDPASFLRRAAATL